ncbi:hypothetical protein HUT27_07405 [Pseudomonas chlororaphis]|uniref:hypothetical protein n=1 Tax=Pseudomonas chlororaphis TaxID=587753 RepID=UPI001B309ECF|nr:hypothetical protein [Pseudomonas chlororaphis]MBP5062048.1 hypothetical protein [Pseudomonas chlororaphis]QTT93300.1 hypothetical protein HUT27_07405 [Pseudomonas chlororaphis]
MATKKSSLSYTERTRIEFLTSHLRSSSRPSVKAKYEDELAQILEGKELTRGDMALAAYYLNNSGTDAESVEMSQAFAQAYRATPAE